MRLFLLTLIFGLFAVGAYAEPISCPEKFAKVTVPSRGRRMRAIAGKAYGFTLRNTVNDYKEAWGEPGWQRPLRLVRRFMFAPRVRETDPEKRLAALKKPQWFAALNEPVFDGAVELASQAWWRTGEKYGWNLKPFERNISMTGGMVISGVTGYGTMAYLTDWLVDFVHPSLETQQKNLAQKDRLGARYLADWEILGILTDEQTVRANIYHVDAIRAWGENISAKNPNRPLPPRLYQLRLEGLLKSDAEVKPLEALALAALHETQAEMKANPRIKQDSEVKRRLRYKLEQSAVFKGRTVLERELLAMVLEPPVFLDGMVSNGWYRGVVEGDISVLRERRKQSDTYWLGQLVKNQKDPTLAKIREDFLKDPSGWNPAMLAAYTALNFSPEARKSIRQLREALLKRQDGN